MKKVIYLWIACMFLLGGCARYERADSPATPALMVMRRDSDEVPLETETTPMKDAKESTEESVEAASTKPEKPRVKVKGIYVSEYTAGTPGLMDAIIENIDKTGINTVVIGVKDDNNRISYTMDSPTVAELGAVKKFVPDIPGLMAKLKEHNVYTITRVVAFRDPHLAEQRPDLNLKLADGSTYRDNRGLAQMNPYKKGVQNYLVEVGIEAHKAGFDEVQFDYIRFSTEKGISDVVYEEADAHGRTKTEIITEFIDYAYEKLSAEGMFVAAGVFDAITDGGQDSDSIGQSYGNMAKNLDYTCPMIYPSHYGDGNFGIERPDTQPYDVVLGALKKSEDDLKAYEAEGKDQAIARPWLQDFTASYLANYIQYGDKKVQAQIQAVYSTGYDEQLLWSTACKYHWGGLLTPEEAETEATQTVGSRAAEPETEPTQEETTVPKTYPHTEGE